MIRKLTCAAFVMTVAFSLVAAEEFTATITKVDGKKITYQKYKKGEKGKQGEKDGDPVTVTVPSDAKIAKGKYDKDAKKLVVGDPIEGGLTNELFTKLDPEKGVRVRITTSDDTKSVTAITVQGGRKKKTTE